MVKAKATKKTVKPHKRVVKTLVVPEEVAIDPEVLKAAVPVVVPSEAIPVVLEAFYGPDSRGEPHHVVIEVAGKPSLWKRIGDWLSGTPTEGDDLN